MKNLIFVFALAAYGALGSEGPLLEKRLTSGYGPVAFKVASLCQVFPGHVVVTKTSGTIEVSTAESIEVLGNIQEQIDLAAIGTLTQSPAPTDGPTTSYTAFHPNGGKSIVLASEGSTQIKNSAWAAATLKNLLDSICR